MMSPLVRRIALTVGASSLVGIGMLTACDSKEKPAETPAPASPSSSAPVSPSEKSVPGAFNPGKPSPQNSFAPSITARPAPTALPGNVNTGG